ncbi:hypothetical protein, partial [Pseudaeromonas pectinilytica]
RLEYRPVTPGVAGSSPVHSATNSKAQTNVWAFFVFEICQLFDFEPGSMVFHLAFIVSIMPARLRVVDCEFILITEAWLHVNA